jgi:hypothetical protein
LFKPIECCKNPLIASGATPIESAGRAPDKIKTRRRRRRRKGREDNIFEPILEFFSTIASEATPVGSTGCAPDEDGKY